MWQNHIKNKYFFYKTKQRGRSHTDGGRGGPPFPVLRSSLFAYEILNSVSRGYKAPLLPSMLRPC